MKKCWLLFLLIPTLCFAQEYQKVKYVVVVRGSEYGEYTYSDWIDDKKVPELFELVGIDQKKVEEGLTAWEAQCAYEKAHPAPYVEPSKADYLSLYEQRITEANDYLGKYAIVADAKDMEDIKKKMEASVVDIANVIAEKPKS